MRFLKDAVLILLFVLYLTGSSVANLTDKTGNKSATQLTNSGTGDRVTLQLIWKNQFQFAGYFMAKEMGFYKNAGLDVVIKEYEFGTDVTGDVMSGKADFGVGRSSLLLEHMEGKPVHLLSAVFQHSPFMLLAKKREDISKVQDLKGKRIMVPDDRVGMASLTAMLVTNRLTPEDYTALPHSFSIDDLISGKTDAMAAYTSNETFQMKKKGVDVTIFSPRDHGYDFYSDILFTSRKLIQNNPGLAARFRSASLKGWEYAFAHIEDTVELILKNYNAQNRTKAALLFEAQTLKKLAYDKNIPLGHIDENRLKQIAQVYQLLGLTSNRLNTDNLIFRPRGIDALNLSPEERAWLSAHKKLVVGGETDWAPFDFVDKTGTYAGIANDYLDIIREQLGLELEIITGPPWNELLDMIRRKEIDILPAIYHSKERETFVNFTSPYIHLTEFIFSRGGEITSFEELTDKVTVVVKGYTIESLLRANYPDFKLKTAPTISDALKMLITGEADAFIGDIISTSYHIRERSLVGIHPVATVPFKGPSVHMAVRKDYQVLKGIMDKVFRTIPRKTGNDIKNRWRNFAATTGGPGQSKLSLTLEESAWLSTHPVIRVHNEQEWPPFNFHEYGQPKGLSIDYMNLLAEILGVKIEYVTGPSWNDFLGMIQKKELDVMLNIVKTEDRQKYLLYTDPYIKNPNIIASNDTTPYQNIEQLFGKTVAVPKGFFYEEILTRSFPQIHLIFEEDTLACLKAVIFGRADAVLGEEAVIRSLILRNMFTGLSISGEVKIGNPDIVNLRLGIRDDWPLLRSVLQKAMASVSQDEMNALKLKWMGSRRQQAANVALTPSEKTWIQTHPVIRANGGEWPPFIIAEEGDEIRGISTQILALAARRVGLEVRYTDGPWPKMQEMLKNGALDLLQCLSKTPEREKIFTFTPSYIDLPDAIYIRNDTKGIGDIHELKGRKLAVDKATHLHEVIKSRYPDILLTPVASVRKGLHLVSDGGVDAYIGPMIVAQYERQKSLITNLKVAGYFEEISHDLRLGALKKNQILIDILQKGLAAISKEEKMQIIGRYIALGDMADLQTQGGQVPPSSGEKKNQPTTGIRIEGLLGYAIIAFLLVSLLAWVLIRTLQRENIAVTFGSVWFRIFVLSGLTLFVCVVALLGWVTLDRNKQLLLQDVDENLRGQIMLSKDRLDLWLTERLSDMARIGRDPELVSITRRLLGVYPEKATLLGSSGLATAREYFSRDGEIFKHIGFFIINPNHVSIGSMRDTNLGTINLISKEHPDLIRRAFQGEVGFVPPMTSDVNLTNTPSDNEKKPPTMFFIGPVKDSAGHVLAVFTLRVDPWNDFARALQAFGGTSSREAYAFDRNGCLLSKSRFDDQLQRIGLLQEGQSSTLNIQIRDPGGNLLEGYTPETERSRQPLTHMVLEALKQKAQVEKSQIKQGHSFVATNIRGYRDYRGVDVFGAWTWDVNLNIGLAVELDVDEALSYFHKTRRMIVGILGITLLLSVGAVLFVLIVGERTSRALAHARDTLEKKVASRTAELTENQKRFAALLESAPDAMVVSDDKGKIVLVNSQTERLLKYDRAELLGKTVDILVPRDKRLGHPENRAYFLKNARVRKMGTAGMALKAQAKDGTLIPVDISLSPITESSGILVVASMRDVTEQQAAEQALLRAKEEAETAREEAETRSLELVNLVHGLPLPTALFDPQGDVMVINQAFTALLGYTIQDIPDVESHWAPFFPDVTYREAIKADWTERVEKSSEEGVPIAPMDLKITAKSGRVYDLQAHTVQIGRVAATMWVDFTEQKRMEKAILDEREQLQQILDTSPVGVAFSTNGVIHFTNPTFEHMFDVAVGDKSPDLYVNPDERDTLTNKLKHGEIVENHELKMYGHNREIRDMLVTYMPISYDGEKGILGWLLDITERKKVEQQIRDKFNELSRFRKLAVGREQKMIALKKEINRMMNDQGQPEKYKIH